MEKCSSPLKIDGSLGREARLSLVAMLKRGDNRVHDRRRRALKASCTAAALLGLAAISLACQSAPASATSAVCARRNDKLAVVSEQPSGSDELGAIKAGGRFRALTKGTYISGPAISCDGQEIAFREVEEESTCGTLGIAKVSAGGARPIPTPNLCPDGPWFLRGGEVVFTATGRAGGGHENTYETNARALAPRLLFTGGQLAAAPDGRWFVGTDRRGNSDILYLLNSRGRRVRPLTPLINPKVGEYVAPSFSPDGRWIVYGRQIYGRPGRTDIFLVRCDGSHLRRLTWGGESRQPSFSPDGHWIAFARGAETRGNSLFALSVRHPHHIKKLAKATATAGFREPSWGL